MKNQLRRLVAPWMIAIVPLTGCASMQQRGGNMIPQWVQNSNQFEAKLAYARLCERHGQTKQALDIYQMLAGSRHAPSKQTALHRMAVMAAKRGDYESAERNFAQATRAATPTSELLNDMGYNYYLMHSLAEAEQCFRQSLDKDPDYVAARNNLGLALGQQGKFDEAMREFAKTGNDSQAHTNMAYVYAQHRYLDQARQHYLKALGHDEKNESAVEGLLQVARAAEHTKAAVAAKGAEKPVVTPESATAPSDKPVVEKAVANVTPTLPQPVEKVAAVDAKPTTPASPVLPSTRRFETGNVSPWANQTAGTAKPNLDVKPNLEVKPQPVVLAPSIPPMVALSQPKTNVAASEPVVAPSSAAPVVPGVSLPKPSAGVESSVAKTQPSKPFGTLWGALTRSNKSSADATNAASPQPAPSAPVVTPELAQRESPSVTLGQPSSMQANSSSAAKSVNPSVSQSSTVAPAGSLWSNNNMAKPTTQTAAAEPIAKPQPQVALESTLPKVTSAAPAISLSAPLLPANPVQTATPQAQASPSAVVTAAHAEPAAANIPAKVQQASPNNLPEVPVRLPVVTPTAPASKTQPTTMTQPQASFPSTRTGESTRTASKSQTVTNPLVAGLAPSLPKPAAQPAKLANPTVNSGDDGAARANRASFIDTTEPTLAPPKSPSPMNTNGTTPAPATPVAIPKSISPPAVAPAGLTPVTPKLPSPAQPVAPPTLNGQQNVTVRQTADRFSAMRAAKDKPLAGTNPQVAPFQSTTPTAGSGAPATPNVLPPNQTTPNQTTPNLAVKPIQLEITGKPSTAAATKAPPVNPSNAKSVLPPRDTSYKAPEFKTPHSQVPGLGDDYRARGLGLDGKANERQ